MKVLIWPNTKCRTYTSKDRLTRDSFVSGVTGDGDGSSIIELFKYLPGVEEVSLRPYEIHVTRSYAYEWDEMEPEIIDTMHRMGMIVEKEPVYLFFGERVAKHALDSTIARHNQLLEARDAQD